MDYVASYLVEGDNTQRLRGFADTAAARDYVERLAVRLSELKDAGRTNLFLASAEVYRFQPSGAVRVVACFDGYDRGDGEWYGWV